MLKGGLHFHTTRSDGKLLPDELIRVLHGQGYDFLAITDHRVYNYMNYAPDIPVTIIPGMEHDNDIIKNEKGFRVNHFICLGPKKEDGNGYEQDEHIPTVRESTKEGFQKILDDVKRHGNFAIYCHPEWSSTPARYFEGMDGIFAMEIFNSTCATIYGMDTSAAYWDELLGKGERIWGVATDDAHGIKECGLGYVMVNAKNSVNGILSALKDGAFYSSCGPVIDDFYWDDGKAVCCCSPAVRVRFLCDMHPAKMITAGDTPITRCEIKADPDHYMYLRAEVTDAEGRKAWTNPIFF